MRASGACRNAATAAEAADVVSLLLDERSATMTGQVVDAEGGFRRYTP